MLFVHRKDLKFYGPTSFVSYKCIGKMSIKNTIELDFLQSRFLVEVGTSQEVS